MKNKVIITKRSLALFFTFCAIVGGGALIVPGTANAGSGGEPGGCAFEHIVNRQVVWSGCSGANLPMWYNVYGDNPNYNLGTAICGYYGSEPCGYDNGDETKE
jgi:hypothetical protein